ncbi:MAG: hypothetical protein LBR56_02680 [Sporomusaceae bacterium]|nr:hypothetical protein [Sporomusaceae bacterium]
MNTNEAIVAKVKEAAKDGRLSCAAAFKLANEENVAPAVIGKAADTAKIKIINCQLGCFNGKSKSHHQTGKA